jgi:oxygen-independent coproporphyrinogen-3 oxidase
MTRFRTSWGAPELNVSFLDSIAERLQELEDDELIVLTEKSCTVTDVGRPFLRNICMAFDSHLSNDDPGKNLFSKTI